MNIYIYILPRSSTVYIFKNSTEKIDCSCEHLKIDTAMGF